MSRYEMFRSSDELMRTSRPLSDEGAQGRITSRASNPAEMRGETPTTPERSPLGNGTGTRFVDRINKTIGDLKATPGRVGRVVEKIVKGDPNGPIPPVTY